MSRRFVSSLSLFASLAFPLTLVDACSSDSSKPSDDAERDASTGGRDAESTSEDDAGTQRDSGLVTPVVDKITNAGASCAESDECTGAGGDENQCLTSVVGLPFPGGYCSTLCVADEECGNDARCPLAPFFGNAELLGLLGSLASEIRNISTCLKTCESASDCREDEDYRCASADEILDGADMLGVDLSVRYCIPPVSTGNPDLDAGTGDAGPDAGDAGDGDAGDAGENDAGDLDAGDAGDPDADVDAAPAT